MFTEKHADVSKVRAAGEDCLLRLLTVRGHVPLRHVVSILINLSDYILFLVMENIRLAWPYLTLPNLSAAVCVTSGHDVT